jgi:lipoate-protein ligase A
MPSKRATWRLIDTGPLAGPANMAMDEALLECFDHEASPPILRLYGWNPPALSLGRFQNADEVLDLDCCKKADLPVVRRITGGGVILHADELTYSIVCAPWHVDETSSIKESFRQLTAFLLCFYRELGLSGRYALDHLPSGTQFGARTPLCFAGRESYDILINGRKIGGNAQRRLKKAIFQHGSIPILDRSSEGASFLRERPAGILETTSLVDCGITAGIDKLYPLLAASFSSTMGVELIPDRLTPAESAVATRLVAEKYSTHAWNIMGE